MEGQIIPSLQKDVSPDVDMEDEESSTDYIDELLIRFQTSQFRRWSCVIDGVKLEFVRERVAASKPGGKDKWNVFVRTTDYNTDPHLRLNQMMRENASLKKRLAGAFISHSIPNAVVANWQAAGFDWTDPDVRKWLLTTTREGRAFQNKDTKPGMTLI